MRGWPDVAKKPVAARGEETDAFPNPPVFAGDRPLSPAAMRPVADGPPGRTGAVRRFSLAGWLLLSAPHSRFNSPQETGSPCVACTIGMLV
jgi:hypothetical protein